MLKKVYKNLESAYILQCGIFHKIRSFPSFEKDVLFGFKTRVCCCRAEFLERSSLKSRWTCLFRKITWWFIPRWKLPGDLSLTTTAHWPLYGVWNTHTYTYTYLYVFRVSRFAESICISLRDWSNTTNGNVLYVWIMYQEGRENLTRYHLANLLADVRSCITFNSIERIDKRSRWGNFHFSLHLSWLNIKTLSSVCLIEEYVHLHWMQIEYLGLNIWKENNIKLFKAFFFFQNTDLIFDISD